VNLCLVQLRHDLTRYHLSTELVLAAWLVVLAATEVCYFGRLGVESGGRLLSAVGLVGAVLALGPVLPFLYGDLHPRVVGFITAALSTSIVLLRPRPTAWSPAD
jgi:hypothetical protein